MNTCLHASDLARYHDGELTPALASRFEAHLATCGQCQHELAQLRGLGSLLREGPLPELRPLALAQLHDGLERQLVRRAGFLQESAAMRMAQWLTGVAAMILVISGLGLFLGSNQRAAADSGADLSWEMTTAMLTQDSSTGGMVTSEHQLAAWIVSDLSSDGEAAQTGSVR